jgi:pyruvate carboxylase subunit B
MIVAGVELPGRARDRGARSGTGERGVLRAVMPGRIVRLLAQPGDAVRRGQGVVVIEAMKMENEIPSPRDGTVAKVLVSPGDRVESGAELAVIE